MIISALIVLSWVSSVQSWAQTPGFSSDEVITYSDGTVMVRNPRLRGLRINSDSDRNGVCKMMGYPSALSSPVEPLTNTDINCRGASVRIDQHGRESGRNECNLPFNTNATISTIRCHPAGYRYTIPTTYLERVENTDGTVSILSPWFARVDAERMDLNARMYIHEGSDMNGVCRHFGLGEYVQNSVVAEDRCEIPARRDDRTARLDAAGRFVDASNCDADMILYITCRR
jgi:hypothetical protein